MIGVMLYTGAQAGGDKDIIIKLELAPNIEAVQNMLAPYDATHTAWLRLNTQLDFVFILTYSLTFFFAFAYILEGKTWSRLAWLAFVPGLLDVVENNFILIFLQHDYSTPYFAIYYWCVHLKWGLIPVLLLPSLGLLVWLGYRGLKGSASR
jgi:hypothetical protein